MKLEPAIVLEPTCGEGSFLLAAIRWFPDARKYIGVDIDSGHLAALKAACAGSTRSEAVELIHADFFEFDWAALLQSAPSPVLILGNPPWVTSSELGGAPKREYSEKIELPRQARLRCTYRKGKYTFASWKVAISGFYKRLHFQVIGPLDGKPVVLDDTNYFLPCESEEHACLIAEMLNSDAARGALESMIFWSDKRPITVEILKRLDLRAVSARLGRVKEFEKFVAFQGEDERKRVALDLKG